MIKEIKIKLPHWIETFVSKGHDFSSVMKRMEFVLSLVKLNIEHNTGGPFAAAIFNHDKLIAAGVNLVTNANLSCAHAEIVALSFAQAELKTFSLSSPGLPPLELVTSTEPCAMCLGAIPWSGVKRVVCGARDEDARAVGFDEGSKIDDWTGSLESRGIEVITDVCRQEAADVLKYYASQGGIIYNG